MTRSPRRRSRPTSHDTRRAAGARSRPLARAGLRRPPRGARQRRGARVDRQARSGLGRPRRSCPPDGDDRPDLCRAARGERDHQGARLMTANIDAVGTSGDIKATYRRYLQSLLAVRDPDIDAALRAAIDSTPMLDKGPYLEATPAVRAGSLAPAARRRRRPRRGVHGAGQRRPAAGPTPLRAPGAGDPQGRRRSQRRRGDRHRLGQDRVVPAADPRQPRARSRRRAPSARASGRCCSTR